MSSSCKGLMQKYVECLRQSDCFKEGGRDVVECARQKVPECEQLRYSLFACRRAQVDGRSRIQGNKGY